MSDQIITKTCSKCKQVKPISEFNKRLYRPCGYESQCRQCRKEYHKKYRQSNKGQYIRKQYRQSKRGQDAENRYRKSKKGKASRALSTRNHKLRHPDRNKARKAITNAIRDGELLPPSFFKCTFCPKQAQQYHHPDYSKPFDVQSVCKKCHKIINRQSIRPSGYLSAKLVI